jgi:hypothetical protein
MAKLIIHHCQVGSFSIVKTPTVTLVGRSGGNSNIAPLFMTTDV